MQPHEKLVEPLQSVFCFGPGNLEWTQRGCSWSVSSYLFRLGLLQSFRLGKMDRYFLKAPRRSLQLAAFLGTKNSLS